ncbi:FAD-binding protein [Pseudoroseomonas cervicalis]|uniref:FAD-binding protein n=1 Tax=Teichococcus cervicalis TaxID=204525 RepID=UPI0035E8B814
MLAPRGLSTRALTGITLYRPQEMVLSARAGTTLPEIEAALAEHRQMIPAEPPDYAALFGVATPPTLGGLVAANLSGPRRISVGGALRDQVLGVRAVTGHAELIRSGGRVHKNVTGLDLCKLLAGSHGTLAVLTEITLKLTPRPEASLTLALPVADIAAGVAALSAGLGSPYGVSGAALLPEGDAQAGLSGPTALLRLEDFFCSSCRGGRRRWRRCWHPMARRYGSRMTRPSGDRCARPAPWGRRRRRRCGASRCGRVPRRRRWRRCARPSRRSCCWIGAAGWSGWPAPRPWRRMAP